MAKSDGLGKITKHQKTKILPLRWIGNICGEFSSNSLTKAWKLDEEENYGYRYKFHCKVFKYLDKPYRWWGTYYMLDINDPILDRLGSDYDEDGIPYWEKWHTVDNVTDSDSLES